MATLEERLAAEGVKTLEELEAKIRTDAEAKQKTTEEILRKQIKDLEEIKAKQGDSVGTLRKELDTAKTKLLELEKNMKENVEEKAEDAGATQTTEEQWKQKNAAREEALTDEDWTKLDEALKGANAETRRLATTSEEGRAAFIEAILGSAQAAQETLRRQKKEKKLSVAEQIQVGLGLLKPVTVPNTRPLDSGFSRERMNQKEQPPPNLALSRTGSLRDLVSASKGA